MLPPSDELNPGSVRERWSWVFWLLLAATAAPLAASVATVRDVLGDEELQAAYNGGFDPDLEFTDRWTLVMAVTVLDWPVVATVLGLLAVTAVAVSGRPGWLAPARGSAGRLGVGTLAAATGAWAAATTVFTLWVVLGPPTARQVREVNDGGVRATLRDVRTDVALSALVVVVAVVVVLAVWRWRPSHPGVVEDAREGAESE